MPSYLLETVSAGRQWEGKYGVNEDFQLQLQGVEKPAILTQKPGTPVPKPGDTMDLTLEPHPRFDDKMKARRPQQAGGFGGPRPEDPKRAKRILRQHSQDMALQVVRLARDMGLIAEPGPQNGADLLTYVSQLADWFDADAEKAGERA